MPPPMEEWSRGIKCYPSLRTDTQITFSLHFTPLGIRLSAFVAQPGAFLVLETIISDIIQPIVKSKHLLDCLKQM